MVPSQCPTLEDLTAFTVGNLPETELDWVAQHLEHCMQCEATARVLDGLADPVIAAIRHAPAIPPWLAGIDRADGATPPQPAGPVQSAEPQRARIADYEILDTLGRGGMGVVYKAQQISLNRIVALKVIREGSLAGPEELARFRNEAQALGRLQHRHIIQIHEIGAHQGQPFFSLEFIDGGTLAQRVHGRPWPARQAAGLVELLALAMHAVHQQGLIHRDLKPANVLLQHSDPGHGILLGTDPEPADYFEPKITDFGLAKRLDLDRGQTGSGEILGTPSYMAPEQAAGKPGRTSPLTDVYALGAMLYELLTGRPPFQGETPLDTLEQVMTQEPVAPTRLQPKLPRDLETITFKCLQKEPSRRYASAAALAEDLHRFLAGEPIQARPVRAWERGLRWARRRPALAALLGVSGLAVVGLALAGWLLAAYQEADHQRAAAQARHERARTRFLMARQTLDKFHTPLISNTPGFRELSPEAMRRQILEATVQFYDWFAGEAADDHEVEAERGRIYKGFGELWSRLRAQDQAKAAYQRARTVFQRLVADHPEEHAYQGELVAVLNNLGWLARETNDRNGARQWYQEALAIGQPLHAAHPEVAEYQLTLARTYTGLGYVCHAAGEMDAAEQAHENARILYQALVGAHPDNPEYELNLAANLHNLATVYGWTGRGPLAEAVLVKGRAIAQRLAGEYPDMEEYHEVLAVIQDRLALVYLYSEQSNRLELAISSFQAAQAIWYRLAILHPLMPRYQESLAGTTTNLTTAYMQLGRFGEARQVYQQLRHHYQGLLRVAPGKASYVTRLATNSLKGGGLLLMLGEYREARAWFAEAITRLEDFLRSDPRSPEARSQLRDLYCHRAVAAAQLVEHAEAQQDLRRARELDPGPPGEIFQVAQALVLAFAGEHVRATAAAEVLATRKGVDEAVLYDMACVYARSVISARQDLSLPTPERGRRAESYAARAVALLRQASASKTFQVPGRVVQLKTDRDLNALRSRDDFQQLLKELETKIPASPR